MPNQRTDDLRIRAVRPLLPPAILLEEVPITDCEADVVAEARRSIAEALHGQDGRLIVITGPCSIHDTVAALEYAQRLKPLADRYADKLLVVMRAYFEKPRTIVGWKGLINDPDIDGSFHINKGLRMARVLLKEIAQLGVPVGTEFLDMTVPQHIADLISWGAIGARTTESQIHRELASGLSMPIGFKNATNGDIKVAVDAVEAAKHPHWFQGSTKQGISAILQTSGNSDCHVILRGGSRTGPNYERQHVEKLSAELAKKNLSGRVMVDCSHGNSLKNHLRQIDVAQDLAEQVRDGVPVFGVMIESNLVEGRQDYRPGDVTYGQSITDACLSLDQTEPLLELLARSATR
ncbi:MAG TPA: 3-deoxy-7-phosphoheptulonate synthase [Fimbriimonas sp.]|nr:3-deoxy-7-phosphoheptulonate synthase [Fimbriimonas sp.]